jgi:hypothetical protein
MLTHCIALMVDTEKVGNGVGIRGFAHDGMFVGALMSE